jgi:hypothetical protein
VRSFRIDNSSLSKATKLPSGALRIPAYLSRVGIFEYKRADGSVFKELRQPEEVFAPASIDSFRGAPLTIGHPGKVTADSWKAVAVGHVSDAIIPEEADGKQFLAASVIIQDATTIAQIEAGELVELSCGYECESDPTPGEFDGQRYDAIQRNIVGNHVAIGPKDWGRAGPDVRMYLDSACSVQSSIQSAAGAIVTIPAEGHTFKEIDRTIDLSSSPITTDSKADNVELSEALKKIDELTAERDALSAAKDAANS